MIGFCVFSKVVPQSDSAGGSVETPPIVNDGLSDVLAGCDPEGAADDTPLSSWFCRAGARSLLLMLAAVLVVPAPGVAQIDICERTTQVRDAIVAATGSVNCDLVVTDHLENLPILNVAGGITEFQEGDFDGLFNLHAKKGMLPEQQAKHRRPPLFPAQTERADI